MKHKIIKTLISPLFVVSPIMAVISCNESDAGENKKGDLKVLKSFNEKLDNKSFSFDDIVKTLNRAFAIGKKYKSKYSQSFKTSNNTPGVFFPDTSSVSDYLISEKNDFSHYVYSPYLRFDIPAMQHVANIKNVLSKYKNADIAFILSQNDNLTTYPSWNGNMGIDGQISGMYKQLLDSINAIRGNDGHVTISLGGANGKGIWDHRDPILMAKLLDIIVSTYKINRIDFDIETHSLQSNISWEFALATAIVQRKMEREGKFLEVKLTLPGASFGMTPEVKRTINHFIKAGVEIKYINIMTMMINKSWVISQGGQVGAQTKLADILSNNIISLYKNEGLSLTKDEASFLLGMTINVSRDTWVPEQMQDKDIKPLYNSMKNKKVGYFSQWTLNVDEAKLPDLSKPTFSEGLLYNNFKNYSKELKNDALYKKLKHGVSIPKYKSEENIVTEIKKLYSKLVPSKGDFISLQSNEDLGILSSQNEKI